MSTLKAPTQGRGHRRSPSDDRRQAAVLRRSNTGPLGADEDDGNMSPSTILSPTRSRSRSPLPPSQVPEMDQIRSTIISLLCRPEIYRPLPPNTIPDPFLSSPHAPKSNASAKELVANGHFYAAAITSARNLSDLQPSSDLATIFDLFYTRLACLTLINKQCLEIAAVESLELRDLTAAMYLDPLTNEHVAPWHLRVLAVRLQSIGFKDWRRGVMSYYILAHDARLQIAKFRKDGDEEKERLWEGRLHDLGIRVANMLVEMGDLEAAGRHLRTLDTKGLADAEKKRITAMQIMVWLQIGDLRAAKRCLAKLYPASEGVMSPTLEAMSTFSTIEEDLADNYAAQVLHALTQMAEGHFALAASEWEALLTSYPNDDMAAANRAICLLYTGQFSQAITELQEIAYGMEGMPHHALLFNLCTFYELSTERAVGLKIALTERLVEKAPSGEGWQRANADFKMDGGGVRA